MSEAKQRVIKVLNKFEKLDKKYRNLTDYFNERITPQVLELCKLDKYALGRVCILIQAIREPMDYFRTQRVPQIEECLSKGITTDALRLTDGEVEMLEGLIAGLEENIDFIGMSLPKGESDDKPF